MCDFASTHGYYPQLVERYSNLELQPAVYGLSTVVAGDESVCGRVDVLGELFLGYAESLYDSGFPLYIKIFDWWKNSVGEEFSQKELSGLGEARKYIKPGIRGFRLWQENPDREHSKTIWSLSGVVSYSCEEVRFLSIGVSVDGWGKDSFTNICGDITKLFSDSALWAMVIQSPDRYKLELAECIGNSQFCEKERLHLDTILELGWFNIFSEKQFEWAKQLGLSWVDQCVPVSGHETAKSLKIVDEEQLWSWRVELLAAWFDQPDYETIFLSPNKYLSGSQDYNSPPPLAIDWVDGVGWKVVEVTDSFTDSVRLEYTWLAGLFRVILNYQGKQVDVVIKGSKLRVAKNKKLVEQTPVDEAVELFACWAKDKQNTIISAAELKEAAVGRKTPYRKWGCNRVLFFFKLLGLPNPFLPGNCVYPDRAFIERVSAETDIHSPENYAKRNGKESSPRGWYHWDADNGWEEVTESEIKHKWGLLLLSNGEIMMIAFMPEGNSEHFIEGFIGGTFKTYYEQEDAPDATPRQEVAQGLAEWHKNITGTTIDPQTLIPYIADDQNPGDDATDMYEDIAQILKILNIPNPHDPKNQNQIAKTW
ncbi:MAG: hypothetical protein ACRDAX_08460 [Propionibacteriaceae bacterium]